MGFEYLPEFKNLQSRCNKNSFLISFSKDGYQNKIFNVGKSKEAKKKKNKHNDASKEVKSQEKGGGAEEDDVYLISSGDEDCSKGMKSMHSQLEILVFMCNTCNLKSQKRFTCDIDALMHFI